MAALMSSPPFQLGGPRRCRRRGAAPMAEAYGGGRLRMGTIQR